MFSWKKIKKPTIILAPMANITTMPFASICKEMGADIIYSPMISSNAIIYNPQKTLKIAEFLPSEHPVIIQIFGYNGDLISKAANIVNEKLKPAGIDINMGCPAPKINKNECGAAILKNYEKAKEIIKIVRNNFQGELSVKLRLGWNKFDIMPFVKYLESIGINSVAIHGRTAKQGYSGKADWEAIHKIARSVKIPVIGNGDIADADMAYDLWRKSDGDLAGVMIGRAALGNPWIFREIQDSKVTKEQSNRIINKRKIYKTKAHKVISRKEIANIIDKQTKRYIKFAGERTAILEMRKHLGWYIKGFPGALEIRKKAMQTKTYKDVQEILVLIRQSK